MSDLRVEIGVGVIIVDGASVLLGRRRGAHGHGTWALPGGHLDFGETIAECAVREVDEETGIAIAGIRQVGLTENIFAEDGRHFLTVFVRAADFSGTPVNREPERNDGWAWFDWQALPRPLFAPLHTLVEQGYEPGP